MVEEMPKEKLTEFELRMKNYSDWRWSGVSLYQGMFIAFVTAAIILLLEILVKQDLILKLIVLAALILSAYELYRKNLEQTQKPIAISENAIGTLEGKPKMVKGRDGKEYVIMNISGMHFKDKYK